MKQNFFKTNKKRIIIQEDKKANLERVKKILAFSVLVGTITVITPNNKICISSEIDLPEQYYISSTESTTETTTLETTSEVTTETASITTMQAEPVVNPSDWDLLARLIEAESGDECTDEHKMWVGQVVLNRVKNAEFPNTISEVIFQTKPALQYQCTINGAIYNTPSERSVKIAEQLLKGNAPCDEDVIWQSEFVQGEIVKTFTTSQSTTYFCK